MPLAQTPQDTTDPAVSMWTLAMSALCAVAGCDTCRQRPAETIKEN